MSDAIDTDELSTEEEADDVPHVEFDISVSPSDPTLELLAAQVDRGDIIIPFYQRRFVWKIEQASRLIESFLMGLPVPQVFLYVNDDSIFEVIDGQQRIMSVKYFIEGLFGEEDNRGKRQVFKLKGLSENSPYNGKTYSDLDQKLQRKLLNSTLRAINIKQLSPNSNYDSVFHIFERLNTGGTQLKPQEIRNAVYRGDIVERLKKLNDTPEWQNILGLKRPDKNQKDVELVLRLFALFENWTKYEKPMLRYLNKQMELNKDFSGERVERFEARFPQAVKIVDASLVKPFRPKGVINSAVLEAVMIAVLEADNAISSEKLKANYAKLMKDPGFLGNITGATTDTALVQSRIARAKSIIQDV